MWLIAGLGNPGRQYEGTRHNAGFIALDEILGKTNTRLTRSKYDGDWEKISYQGQEVILVRPMTYMNFSGRTVGGLAGFFRVPPAQVIALHDDLDIDNGRLLLRLGGSPSGHNGLRSIVESIGTRDFIRVRIGVGRPIGATASGGENPAVTGWVLGVPPPGDREPFHAACVRGAEAALAIVANGFAKAQNEFNRRG